MKLLCFDGNSIMNRAYYGIKLLTTKDGRYTNAVYGFTNIFLRVISDINPDAVVVAFDLPGKTFRHNMYEGYKATRKGMPDELAQQMPVIKELIEALGYRSVGVSGYEADDILGTFSRICNENDWECIIATGDRDVLQLVTDRTKILLTTTKFGRGETSVIDKQRIYEDYTLAPFQLIDLKSLIGDRSDCIPGVAGIGEKTAIPLVAKFLSLDGIYENIDDESITESIRKKLIADKEVAYLSKELATINQNVPLIDSPNDYQKSTPDNMKITKLLTSLEMYSILEKLNLVLDETENTSDNLEQRNLEVVEAIQMTKEDIPKDEIFIMLSPEGMFASVGTKLYQLTREMSKAVLGDEGIKKYCYDLKNMYHYALNWDIEIKNVAFDILLAAYLLNPSASDYLPLHLAMEYDIKPIYISESIPEMGLVEPLARRLETQLIEKNMMSLLLDIEIPLSLVLVEMERKGFLIDKNGIQEFGDRLKVKLEEEKQAIYAAVGKEFNVNSTKQLADALFIDLGLPPGRKTKSGYSTDAEVLNGLKGTHPVIDSILNFRSYSKLLSTYVEGLLKVAGDDSKIHTEFKQTETRTGRISSLNPNLQNIPVRTELGAEMRKFFISGENNILLDADYSQIELRVLASLSNDENMINAFEENDDIHLKTAAQVFGLPQDMITPELRRRAKAVNFGIVYGIGAYSLSEDIGVSIYEAAEYIDNYLRTYSSVRDYLEKTVEDAKENGYITTMFGRRRLVPELVNSNRTVQALGRRLAMNTPIQGTAADIIKIAMIRVQNRLKEEGLSASLILQVHDELIVETSIEDKSAAKKVLVEEMQNAVKLKVDLVVDVGEGYSWYDAK